VGNGILFLQARHKLFSWFVKCERQFGFETFQISVPSLPPGVVINDPKNLEYVLKNEGIFAKGDFFKRRSWDLFGNVTFITRDVVCLLMTVRKWNHQFGWRSLESSAKSRSTFFEQCQFESPHGCGAS
jgi:hypothetical protein